MEREMEGLGKVYVTNFPGRRKRTRLSHLAHIYSLKQSIAFQNLNIQITHPRSMRKAIPMYTKQRRAFQAMADKVTLSIRTLTKTGRRRIQETRWLPCNTKAVM